MTTRGPREETEFRWRQFTDLPRTRIHWEWRNGWRAGRWSYWWYVDLTGQPALTALAAGHLADLGNPGWLDPAVNLHVSLQQVGFTDMVTAARAARVLSLARRRLRLAPLTLRFGPVDPNPESLVLRVDPWDEIQSHRLRLRRVTEEVVGEITGADDHFWPHVSIGYTSTETPTAPIARALRDLPERSVTVTVRELSLVRLNRDDRLWRWETVGVLPLRAPL